MPLYPYETTPLDQIPKMVREARATFATGRTLPLEWRLKNLNGLYDLVNDNKADIISALHADLRKPTSETTVSEIAFVSNECALSLDNLKSWMAPQSVEVQFINKFDGCQIRPQPFGTSLVIGAWNYPIQLTLY